MAYKYTSEFGTQGGYNTPQPGMTPVKGSGTRYYGNDGFIYNMTDGSRRRGDPPAEVAAPAPTPQPVSSGYTKPSAPEAAPEPEVTTPEATQEEKRAEITKPAAGLETTIVAPPSPTVSYLTGNTAGQTASRFLKKKKVEAKQSLFA
jgi:hypothetical protein